MDGIKRFLLINNLLRIESLLSYVILLSIAGIAYEKWECLYGVGVCGVIAIVRVYFMRRLMQAKPPSGEGGK